MKELRDTISSAEPAFIARRRTRRRSCGGHERRDSLSSVDDRLQRRHPLRAELAIYYACREATQNAIKHAGDGATRDHPPD